MNTQSINRNAFPIASINTKGKIFTFCLLFVLVSTSIYAQITDVNLPKSYIANYTLTALDIDGIANEVEWKETPWTDEFTDIEGVKTPKYKTKVKMLWDDDFFYFYAELEEPHIWGDITKRDAVIFYNNDFEIFMDPDGDSHNYMEFEINALNTIWDLFITRPYRNGNKVLDNWDINGAKTAINIDGTLNDPSDIDKKWSVEIALPWSVILEGAPGERMPKNDYWRINFSRVNWDFDLIDGKYERKRDRKTKKYLPEYNWVWSPQGVINMHEPEKWGYVFFSTKNPGSNEKFKLSNDEYIRLKLFKIHNEQRNYFSQHQTWNLEAIPSNFEIMEKQISLTIEHTSSTYVISAKSPFTNRILRINNLGKLTTHK